MAGRMIGSSAAAAILGVDRRTVNRLFNDGMIPGNATQRGVLFDAGEMERYATSLRDRAELDSLIKEAYVFDAFGCLQEAGFAHPMDKMESALGVYRSERGGKIAPQYPEPGNVFMVGEVTARLGISDTHIVYRLLSDGHLRQQENCSGGRIFVEKESFGEYLGGNLGERFCNSGCASMETGKTVHDIDRLALRYAIGRKINEGERNSGYLFTKGDIALLRCYGNGC